jgi:uncharacterized protein (TIGR02391 family)
MSSGWPLTEEEATTLPVDTVALRLLRKIDGGKTTLRNIVAELQATRSLSQHYQLAISEAWHWLLANGLITEIPMEEGWCVSTRLARKLLEEIPDPVAHVQAERRIAVDLHPLIRESVRAQFLLGEYQAAVMIAMRTVEERVRELAGASDADYGASLMQKSFGPGGKLRDSKMVKSEADSEMFVFRGAIGYFKNPVSHRQVHYEDATEASETVLFADLLLRILDRIEARSS